MAEALVSAATPALGRDEAFRVVTQVCGRAVKERLDLREAAHRDEALRRALAPEEIDAALDPGSYLGSSARFVARAVERFREVRAGAGP